MFILAKGQEEGQGESDISLKEENNIHINFARKHF